MKYLKFTNILVLIYFLVASLGVFNSAHAAGWVLPANPGNLMDDFDQGVLNLTNWLLGFATMAGVTALVWGGINYLVASGDTQKADLSKRIIYYAVIGLFVAGLSYALIRVVTTVILK